MGYTPLDRKVSELWPIGLLITDLAALKEHYYSALPAFYPSSNRDGGVTNSSNSSKVSGIKGAVKLFPLITDAIHTIFFSPPMID